MSEEKYSMCVETNEERDLRIMEMKIQEKELESFINSQDQEKDKEVNKR